MKRGWAGAWLWVGVRRTMESEQDARVEGDGGQEKIRLVVKKMEGDNEGGR